MDKSNSVTTSWDKNAQEWIRVIDADLIPSRKFTNPAILDAVEGLDAKKMLDLGCGEGWLTREVSGMGKKVVGIDASAALLNNARTKGPESYYCLRYEDVVAGQAIPEAPYGTIICNFCLYDKDSLTPLLQKLGAFLDEKGQVLIQTLHPFFLIQQGLPYQSQWLRDSWKGLPGNFTHGHSWYARTLEDWVSTIGKAGMRITQLTEVVNDDQRPISLLLILEA
ncbi:MAG: methyltransferase domain-containing protein [Bacteroidota bacterium]